MIAFYNLNEVFMNLTNFLSPRYFRSANLAYANTFCTKADKEQIYVFPSETAIRTNQTSQNIIKANFLSRREKMHSKNIHPGFDRVWSCDPDRLAREITRASYNRPQDEKIIDVVFEYMAKKFSNKELKHNDIVEAVEYHLRELNGQIIGKAVPNPALETEVKDKLKEELVSYLEESAIKKPKGNLE